MTLCTMSSNQCSEIANIYIEHSLCVMNSNSPLSSVPLLTLIFHWVSEAQVACLRSHRKWHGRRMTTGGSQGGLVPFHAVLSLPWTEPGKTLSLQLAKIDPSWKLTALTRIFTSTCSRGLRWLEEEQAARPGDGGSCKGHTHPPSAFPSQTPSPAAMWWDGEFSGES